jgi:LPXTG-site transpeptidase (sortase) family protein
LNSGRQRFLSNLAIVLGGALLLSLVLFFAYQRFYGWLADQQYYLVSNHVARLDVPAMTPTLTPTITPTPTEEPNPLPPIRIIIPKIGLNEKIVETGVQQVGSGANAKYVWETPAYAVGHRNTSGNPGQRGNIVLSGHNNTLGEVFRNLDKLEPGDLIYLYTFDAEFIYAVQEKNFVLGVNPDESDMAEHARYTARTPDETLTLISCWPYVTYTHRIYITAKRQE